MHIYRLQLHFVIAVAESTASNLLNATNFACWLVGFASIIACYTDNWLIFFLFTSNSPAMFKKMQTEKGTLSRLIHVTWSDRFRGIICSALTPVSSSNNYTPVCSHWPSLLSPIQMNLLTVKCKLRQRDGLYGPEARFRHRYRRHGVFIHGPCFALWHPDGAVFL